MIDVLVWVVFGIWYVAGLAGSHVLTEKGYTLAFGPYLWGAMLGPLQLLFAWLAPSRHHMNDVPAQPVCAGDGWPRSSAKLVSSLLLSEEEQMLIRRAEEEQIAVSKLELEDICNNCQVKPQFIETYRVLRRDRRDTLNEWRARLNASEMPGGLPLLIMRIYETVVSYKLQRMADHFYARWNERIEDYVEGDS